MTEAASGGHLRTIGGSTSWFDRLLMRHWPSTQDGLQDDQYFSLISGLYEDVSTLVIGYAAIFLPISAYAWVEGNAILAGVMVAMSPVMMFRVVQCRLYKRRSVAARRATVYRDEVRYVAGTVAVVLAIDVITTTAMVLGGYSAVQYVTAIMVLYTAGIMARNANSPQLVTLLSILALAPIVLGLLLSVQTSAAILAFVICMFTKHVQRRSYEGKRMIVDALHQADEAKRLANFDALTGLPNRYRLKLELQKWIEAADQSAMLSALMIDLDGFKAVNDCHGHPTGDELLRVISDRLRTVLAERAPESLVARLGGDEFIILTSVDDGPLASALIAAIEAPVELETGGIIVGASIGIMRWRPGIGDVALLKGADLALYAAKAAGRGSFRYFDDAMFAQADLANLREQRFRAALMDRSLSMVFQPIFDLNTGDVTAFEALARWNDEVLGLVPPNEFVAIAEKIGLIERMSGQLLLQTCLAAQAWPKPTPVSFNISPTEFLRPNSLLVNIENALTASRLDPRRLAIEITEGVLIGDFDTVLKTLDYIKAMGVRIYLDDFGSGYSSLSYLSKFGSRLDAIKLDKSIVQSAAYENIQQSIISMVAKVAHVLGSTVIAEGIEHVSLASEMRALGVSHAQGFGLGKPSVDIAAVVPIPSLLDLKRRGSAFPPKLTLVG